MYLYEEYSAHDWRAATSVQRAPVTWREWGLCFRPFPASWNQKSIPYLWAVPYAVKRQGESTALYFCYLCPNCTKATSWQWTHFQMILPTPKCNKEYDLTKHVRWSRDWFNMTVTKKKIAFRSGDAVMWVPQLLYRQRENAPTSFFPVIHF